MRWRCPDCTVLVERPGRCARCEALQIPHPLDREPCGYCLDPDHTVATCPRVWAP